MKKLISFFFISFIILRAYPQGGIGGPGGGITTTPAPIGLPQLVPPTPDVMAMQKYGEIPVGHYTGIPAINVPIYTLNTTEGIQVPLNINYHASGIKVDEIASRVGLGWSFNSPGIISKQIIGIEDTSENFPRANTFNPNYYSSVNDYTYALRLAKGENSSFGGGLGTPADTGYDIYSYNFLGRSGKFFIDKNSNIHTIPSDEGLKIVAVAKDIFDITDEQGNVYQFRDLSQTQVTSYDCPPQTFAAVENEYSWTASLKKIIAPNGEEIVFNYRAFSYSYSIGRDETAYFNSTTFSNSGCTKPSDISCLKTSINAESVLSSINYKQTQINFLYSDDVNLPINGSTTRKDLEGNHALRKVIVEHNNVTIKNIEFQYDYFNANIDQTSDSFRLKLTKVIDNNLLTHEFEYNQSLNLPKRLSYSQDFYGFYNGKTNSTLISEMYYGAEFLSGANRLVDPSYTQANILSKIIYPTKGYVRFYYENNDYYDNYTQTNKYGGGLRVQKIEKDSGTGVLEKIFYSYKIEGSNQSSGIQQGEPLLSKIIRFPHPNGTTQECKYLFRVNSSIYPLASEVGKYVGYGYVTERLGTINSNNRVLYKFTNYAEGSFNGGGSSSMVGVHPIDYSWKKGKLIYKKFFNQSNELVYKEENTYEFSNYFASTSSDYYDLDKLAAGFDVRIKKNDYYDGGSVYIPAEFEWNYYYIKSSWIQLIENVKTSYYGVDSLKLKSSFSYDNPNHVQLTKTEVIKSNGDTIKSKYFYAHDLGNTTLINQHRIGELIDTKGYKNSNLIHSQSTIYNTFNSNYLPEKIQTSKGTQSLEDRLTYHSYDDKGNPTEVSKKDGTHIVYIWGYSQSQPLAKIENTTMSLVTTAIGTLNGSYNTLAKIQTLSNNDTDESSENSLRTALADLRAALLNNAMMSSYTYDPLIGVTSVTDPRGRTQFYHYDSFNRLQYVKDHEGNILSENQYNYKN